MAKAVDEKAVNRQTAVELAASPGTLIPVGLGLVGLMIFGPAGIPAFLSVLLATGGVGGFLVRWLRGGDKARERARKKLELKAREQAEKELDTLYRQLRKDGDDRTHKLLETLRGLIRDLRNEQVFAGVDSGTAEEMVRGIDQLFVHSVASLQNSLVLLEKIRSVSSEGVRDAIEKKREGLVNEVAQNVDQVATLIAEVASLEELASESTAAALRDKLKEELRIAKQVNSDMSDVWDQLEGEPVLEGLSSSGEEVEGLVMPTLPEEVGQDEEQSLDR